MSEALGSVTESVAGSGLGVVKPNPGELLVCGLLCA